MEEAAKRNFYIQEIKRLYELLQCESVWSKLNQFEVDEYIKLLDSNFQAVRLENIFGTRNTQDGHKSGFKCRLLRAREQL